MKQHNNIKLINNILIRVTSEYNHIPLETCMQNIALYQTSYKMGHLGNEKVVELAR